MTTRDASDLLLLAALWGGSYLFMRMASPEFGPIALIQIRVIIAALVLLPWFLREQSLFSLLEQWQPLLIVGITNSALPFCLIAYSTLYLSAGLAGMLNASAPLFGALVAGLWLGERLRSVQFAGLAFGFFGVGVLVWDKVDMHLGGSSLAALSAILAAVFYGWSASYTRKNTGHMAPLTLATGSMLTASIVLIPLTLAYWPSSSVSATAWISVTVLGVACTGLAYILYFRLIQRLGPTGAISVTYMVPVFAVVWGMLFLEEVLTVSMIVGAAVILSGTALVNGLPGRSGNNDDGEESLA